MPDFLQQLAMRLVVMVPVIMIAAALLWYGLRALGKLSDRPFNSRDMRTWPLKFALADAALFAATFAVVAALMPGSEWSAAVGGGVAAIVAIAIGPWLLSGFAR